MKIILVTGDKGQLASCHADLGKHEKILKFIFVDSKELDVTKKEDVSSFLKNNKIDYCINYCAYTAIDKAETEKELAPNINAKGAQYLAEAFRNNNAIFILIVTDFVFDGKTSIAYNKDDLTYPLSIYGITKLNVEIANATPKHFIKRTSRLYPEQGNNFQKTMPRLGSEKDKISIVVNQIGTPTYVGDLAELILKIITEESFDYGSYHYSNEGVVSWCNFAKAIFDNTQNKVKLNPIKRTAYPDTAKKYTFIAMDKSKIKNNLSI
jgi:dTDP-4-dehydrorhamnose reductase